MSKKTWVLLFGILIIATFLRTYHLKTLPPGLYPDEAMNGSDALQALETHNFKVFYPENNGREGLFMNIQAVFVYFLGAHAWALRLPSAIFGILTVLGLFFFVRELFRRDDAALLAAFFLATSFWHINFSRIGFRAITASFFLVWALYFFLASLRRRSWPLTVLAGISFGLGFYSYISFRVMPLLFLLFIPFLRRREDFWKISAVFILAVFLVGAPIGWYFLKHPADFFGRTSEVSVTHSASPLKDLSLNIVKTIGMLNIQGDGNWRHNLSGRPELFWPVGILFWAGIIIGAREIFRNRTNGRLAYILLFVWLILAALPVVMSDEGIPHALRSILMVLPIMVLAAMGAVWLWENYGSRLPLGSRVIITLLFAVALTAEAYHTYFVSWGRNPNVQGAFAADYAAIAEQINSLPRSEMKYVAVEAGGTTVAVTDPEGRTKQIPMPAQTVMFLTQSFTAKEQAERNIRYILPPEEGSVPPGSAIFYVR